MKRVITLFLFAMAVGLHAMNQINLPIKPIKLPQPVDSFTIFPVAIAAISSIIPLGNLNPTGHTFPTDHCYINLVSNTTPTSVWAPGNVKLFNISRSQRFKENTTELIGQDYTLMLSVNATYYIRFDHLSALSPTINNLLSSAIENDCNTYNTGGVTYKQCRFAVNLPITAGTEMGKVGGQSSIAGLDFGAYTHGVLSPNGVVCPFTFFKQTIFDSFKSKFGNGFKQRTTPPLCGTVLQDVVGTLKGRWLKQGQPYYPEDPHIAFVGDNIDPSIPAISVGKSQPGLPPQVYTYKSSLAFVAVGSNINYPFTNVTNDGKTYCFNLMLSGQSMLGSLIVKMNSTITADIEYRPNCNCTCNKPYTFTNNKVSYEKAPPIH